MIGQEIGSIEGAAMTDLWILLIVLTVVVLISATRRRNGAFRQALERQLRTASCSIETLQRELERLFPLFAAETADHREAEFIRDSLPRRFPFWPTAIGLLALALVLAWRYL